MVRYKYFVLPQLRVYTAMHNMINTFSGFRAESLILSLPYTRTIYIIRTYTYYNMMYLPIYLMTDAFTTYALHRVEVIFCLIHISLKSTFSINCSRVPSSMLQGITRSEQAGLLPHHHHHHHHHHHQSLTAHHGIGTGSAWPPNHHDDLAHKGK